MREEQPIVSIVMVHYKTIDYTCDCIRSIQHVCKLPYEIIVVDNCSQDGSETIVSQQFPFVQWITSETNEGFGRANNIGAKKAKGQFLCFVNTDMLFTEDSFSNVIDQFKQTEGIGVLGCQLLNRDGSTQLSVYKHVGTSSGILKNNLIYAKFFFKEPTEIQAVMGAFMLIPKTLFDTVQGFDPDFFMYGEELELCHRIRKLGYSIVYTTSTAVIHFGGGSSDHSWSSYQAQLSTALLHLKTGGYLSLFKYHFLRQLNFITNGLLLWKMDANYRKDFKHDLLSYLRLFPYFVHLTFVFRPSRGKGIHALRYFKRTA